MTTVSIVIPCYRYGSFLRQCVESVLSQEGVDAQVLIIDDASPDDSASVGRQLASEHPRVVFHAHEVNKGHIATYNEGIDWASGEYFLLLSADDYLLPGALKRSTNLLDRHPGAVFAFGRVIELRDRTGVEMELQLEGLSLGKCDARIMTGSEFIKASGARNAVPTPTAIVRTFVQKRIGGYRSELPHAGDMEMWFRLAAQGFVGVLGAHQAVYRRHGDNMSLDFMERHWLPDLQQRKLAIDMFCEDEGRRLVDICSLHANMLQKLSREAIGWASGAFNAKEFELCRELMSFAVDVEPSVRSSNEWRRLRVKQAIGLRVWSMMRPAYSYAKQLRDLVRK